MTIRPATTRDVPAIAALISLFAQRGKMLFRSHAELYESLRDFHVAVTRASPPASAEHPFDPPPASPAHNPAPEQILGICALEIIWADPAEIRSLAVPPPAQRRGIGQALVHSAIDEARLLLIHQVFALTYEQPFFEKLGFAVVDKSALPQKVWSGCIKCPKRLQCDEIALVRTLPENPPADDPPDSHADLHYEVPTPLIQIRRGDNAPQRYPQR
jgi:amino-acid N-acetyltransferase